MHNTFRFLLGGALLSGAAALALPQSADAWSTIGGSLGLSQRDQRIFDNFTDSAAHNNNTAHPNWPGYTQIELACWKAGAEWGSRPFGDGTGDSQQTNVGDGNANFNFFFEGEAFGIGSTNDNINSELAGSSGGVLAFTETPISDGWRIRYYSSWNWQDGPDGVGSGIDFQGVATHELGHALGLGHSNFSAATMYFAISGTGVPNRSIENDDRNGIQLGVYGARDDAAVPSITSVSGSTLPGGTAIITGTNFSATGNEVWLNNTTAGGVPYKVTGLASTAGGTQITFNMPNSGVESGGMHVKNSRTDHKALSEGHPYDYGTVQTDTILLSGPNVGFTNQNVMYDWSNAPASSPWWFYYSLNDNGTTINGHQFDIGDPVNTGGTGTTDALGNGTITVHIPGGAAGLVVYLEVRVDDSFGTTFDSNMLTLNIF
ncbi:MAG: matrixin family metalloprotease [Planctomycetota bacterium]|nr:MAG: matrixin family metalloprotease [Planctomycetota bacterium]